LIPWLLESFGPGLVAGGLLGVGLTVAWVRAELRHWREQAARSQP
jgi:hypothetical protein